MSLLHIAGGATDDKLDASDVFSAYVRTGTGADVVVTTGIDYTKGFMSWTKGRSGATDHAIYDSARGVTKDLVSNSTAAQTTQATGLKAVSTTGHTIGSLAKMNTSGSTYVDYVWRKAPKFFDVVTVTHTSGTASTVDLSSLNAVGMVTVKATNTTSNWFTWHRGLTAGNNLKLNLIDAQSPTNAYLSVSGTTLTIASTASSATYIVYAWAHDTSADGIIQCGSFTADASGNVSVNLGWEPQYLMTRKLNAPANWEIVDSMRGFSMTQSIRLESNTANIEFDSGIGTKIPTAIGFSSIASGFSASTTYIYMAIRRQNKVPTSGSEVYNAIARTGTGAAATVTGVGFAPDLVMPQCRSASIGHYQADRIRGVLSYISSATTEAEFSVSNIFSSFNMDGVSIEGNSGVNNSNGQTYINHFFKRAKGFMTITAHTDLTSSDAIAHDLGVIPEMIWAKCRSTAEDWFIYHKDLTSGYTLKFTTAAEASDASRFTNLSATQFTYGGGTAARTRIFYSFATLAGISKVFTFTADISKTINCGFTTGARFIMLKKKNGTGSFYIWDSVRGIVSGNDPYLLLDSTAAEVTSTDLIDPEASGFISNFTDGGVYVGYAIS